MRFVRYGEAGRERPGVFAADGTLRDLGGVIPDLAGSVLGILSGIDPEGLPRVSGEPRLGVPVADVGKIVCIGLNYSDHAEEAGMAIPTEPIVFMKATSALTGPTDPIFIPRGSQKTDWEVELGVVIGRRAKYVPKDDALDHVAGYTIVNDISERAFQLERGGQWTKGKSADSFAPVGPWLVTPDEVGDPQALGLGLTVNGETMQDGRTNTMIFGVAEIISYVSSMMSLHPGDIIATGTPPGVGMGRRPQRYLRAGDRVETWIEGLGRQRQDVLAES